MPGEVYPCYREEAAAALIAVTLLDGFSVGNSDSMAAAYHQPKSAFG